jgi:hypothetical protein
LGFEGRTGRGIDLGCFGRRRNESAAGFAEGSAGGFDGAQVEFEILGLFPW